jgi:hypothetical protein
MQCATGFAEGKKRAINRRFFLVIYEWSDSALVGWLSATGRLVKLWSVTRCL